MQLVEEVSYRKCISVYISFINCCIIFNTFIKGQGTVVAGDNNWSPAGGGGRSAIQFSSGVDAIVAGGGGGGGYADSVYVTGRTQYWSPATTGPLGE